MLIEIHAFSFTKIYLKMSSGKWRPFYLGLNVLKLGHQDNSPRDGQSGDKPYCIGYHYLPPLQCSGHTPKSHVMCNKTWKRVQLKSFHDLMELWHIRVLYPPLKKIDFFRSICDSNQFLTFWPIHFSSCVILAMHARSIHVYPMGPVYIFDKTSYCCCRYRILERWYFH